MIEAVCKVFEIKSGAIEIGCDGISALKQGIVDTDVTNPQQPQFDLIAAIRGALRRVPISWKPRHVKGHQENDESAVLD